MMTSQKEVGEKERKKKVYKFECLEKKNSFSRIKSIFYNFSDAFFWRNISKIGPKLLFI